MFDQERKELAEGYDKPMPDLTGKNSEETGKFPRISPRRLAFAHAIEQAYVTRNMRELAFVNEVSAAMKQRGVKGGAPDRKSLANWRDGKTLPQPRLIEPILDVLCHSAHDADRQALHDLWHDARSKDAPGAAEQAGTHFTNNLAAVLLADLPPSNVADWDRPDPLKTQGLAVLFIDPPPPSNDPGTFQLRASLSLGEDRLEEAKISWRVWLSAATLTPSYHNCQPAQSTCLGEAQPHDHPCGIRVTLSGGNWKLSSREASRALRGSPLGDEQLALMYRGRKGLPKVTLTLTSSKRQIHFAAESRAVSPLREKLTQLYLQEKRRKTEAGEVTWAKATLQQRRDACG